MLWTLLLSSAMALEPGLGVAFAHQTIPIKSTAHFGPQVHLHARLRFRHLWATEANLGYQGNTWEPRLAGVRYLGRSETYFQPFFLLGAGAQVGRVPATWIAETGVGADIETWSFLDIRVDARYRNIGGTSAFWFAVGLQLHTIRPHDSDNDGRPDRNDTCPTEPEDVDGHEDLDGCPDPDNDADGLIDSVDECPDQPEDIDSYLDADGCPDPNNDSDRLLDHEDTCPNVAEDYDGFGDNDGCPDLDNDSDGVPDAQDRCPYEAETNNSWYDGDGCPDWLPADLDEFIGRVDGIEFYRDSFRLYPHSKRKLLVAIAIIEHYPGIHLEVQGHTDDIGDEDENLQLSQFRADQIKEFLVLGGIPKENIIARGYGESYPIMPNTTEKNRAHNRRVEIRLLDFDPLLTMPVDPDSDDTDSALEPIHKD